MYTRTHRNTVMKDYIYNNENVSKLGGILNTADSNEAEFI